MNNNGKWYIPLQIKLKFSEFDIIIVPTIPRSNNLSLKIQGEI